MTPERIQQLMQILWESVKNPEEFQEEEIQKFVQAYGNEVDEDFIGYLLRYAKDAEGNSDEHVSRIRQSFAQVGQILPELRQNVTSSSQDSGLSEAEIKAENDALRKLLERNPNAAYPRAIANLQNAQQTNSDDLIYICAITLALAAEEYRPNPKLEEVIAAYQLASEKALAIGNDEMYAALQGNLGNAYRELPTGDRSENLCRAITCFENALHIFTVPAFPEDYAKTQFNLGNTYRELPIGDRDENLRHAITCFENALRIFTEADFPQDYARTQMMLGITYSSLPTRDRSKNLRCAITCFENALHIFTEAEFPQDYALTQMNLGNAYFELPIGDRSKNLRWAITCFENALHIFTEVDFPQEYAQTQMDLGTAYAKLPIGDRNENLHLAITCFENALHIFTEATFPYDYARTQMNLGVTYCSLPTRDRSKNLRCAITCFENALHILTEVDFPQEYAQTQVNLGNAYAELPIGDRNENLHLAITCFENALRIFTEVDFPQGFATTQHNLGVAYFNLLIGDRSENLRLAITAYQNALHIFTEAAFPQEYVRTQMNLGIAYMELPTGDRRENLSRAIACFENILHIFTEAAFSQGYARAQMNLGTVYVDLPTGDRGENLRRAIACFENALRIYTEAVFPYEYAVTQMNLGNAYKEFPTGDRSENLRRAIACFENALRIFTAPASPGDYAKTQFNLGNTYRELPIGDRGENLRRAITCYENALRIYAEGGFSQEWVGALNNLALTYDDDLLNDKQNAYNACAEAIRVLEMHVRAVSSTETRRTVAKDQAKIYHKMVSLCTRLDNMNEAFSYAERGKSRTLVEMLHTAQLQPSENVPQNIRQAFLKVREKLDDLRYRQQVGECETPRDFEVSYDDEGRIRFRQIPVDIASSRVEIWEQLDSVQQAYQKLLQEIRELDPKFAAAEQVQPITIEEIEALIPEKTVLVECFMGNEGTYIFAFNSKNEISYTTLVLKEFPISEVDYLVNRQWYTSYYARGTLKRILNLIVIYLAAAVAKTETSEELSKKKEQVLVMICSTLRNFVEWREESELTLPFDFQHLKRAIESDQFDEIAEILKSFDAESLFLHLDEEWHATIKHTVELLAKKFWYAKDEHGKSLAELVKQSDPERIVFIPHFGLHLLPLHLIPLNPDLTSEPTSTGKGKSEPSQGLRLMDKYEIAYAPSATLLRFALQRERNNLSHLFAVANPDQSLTFTDAEVRGILEHFDEQQILWHKQATKDTVYKQAKVANIVHFSCHGNYRYGDPMESRLSLVGDDEDKKDLTLRDIFANLKLPNAAAVVLFACETGMVQLERGDEYIGLPSGFLYAGAPTVISSLWAVDDLSTSLLMNRLYENMLQKKMGKAAALRDAQLWVRDLTYVEILECLEREHFKQHVPREIIRSYKLRCATQPDEKPFEHPYYWGAFTCNGDWK